MVKKTKDDLKQEDKVVGEIGNKMMPKAKSTPCKVIMEDTVFHKGVIYRKGSSYEVDSDLKTELSKYAACPKGKDCNCK